MIVFSVNLPKIAGKGEDANPLAEIYENGSGVTVVFDGLGGSGSTKYELDGNVFTGAWFASRLVKCAIAVWFRNLAALPGFDPAEHMKQLENGLRELLRHAAGKLDHTPSKLRSNLIRRLPTTLSGVYFRFENGRYLAWTLNAGDSRTYFLTPQSGLQILTEDDEVGPPKDALLSLYGDGRISNCLDADSEFKITVKKYDLPAGIFVSASDGCFDYVKFPAQFEYFLLDTMMRSGSVDEWKVNFLNEFKTFAGDDVSIALISREMKDIGEMKAAFAERHELLAQKYVQPIDAMEWKVIESEGNDNGISSARNELRKTLWEEYRKDYEILMSEEPKPIPNAER